MNAACFAATLDFEDALVATIGKSLSRNYVGPDGCAFSGCVHYGKSTSIRRSLRGSRLWIFCSKPAFRLQGVATESVQQIHEECPLMVCQKGQYSCHLIRYLLEGWLFIVQSHMHLTSI